MRYARSRIRLGASSSVALQGRRFRQGRPCHHGAVSVRLRDTKREVRGRSGRGGWRWGRWTARGGIRGSGGRVAAGGSGNRKHDDDDCDTCVTRGGTYGLEGVRGVWISRLHPARFIGWSAESPYTACEEREREDERDERREHPCIAWSRIVLQRAPGRDSADDQQ